MNKLDKDYQNLLQDILDNGVTKSDRTGTGTISVFGRQIRHNMKDGFPLLTTKKMAWKTLVTELIWFLNGDTNIKFLVDNNCYIWDGDAYKRYSVTAGMSTQVETLTKEEFINKIKTDDEFAKKWGELGPVYGKQWRRWNGQVDDISGIGCYHDQIQNLINDLKTNPDSRRLMVNAWNVGELDQMVLPPCHYGFQVYTKVLSQEELRSRYPKLKEAYDIKSMYIKNMEYENAAKAREIEKQIIETLPIRTISLMWNQRSVDTFLGLPFNIASYGLLLEIIAKAVNMVPDELIGNLGDTHLYLNHVDQATEQIGRELSLEERKQIFEDSGYVCDVWPFNGDWSGEYDGFGIPKRTREPYPLPTLNINTEFWQTESGECGVGPLATNLTELEISDFTLENYQSHPSIKAPLSN